MRASRRYIKYFWFNFFLLFLWRFPQIRISLDKLLDYTEDSIWDSTEVELTFQRAL